MHLAVKTDSPFNNLHRFMQKATTKTEMIARKNSSSNKISSKFKIFYDVEIYTIKANDPIGFKYNPFTCKIALNKNIDFYQRKRVVRSIPFNTFMFLDGVLVFDDLNFFFRIKTIDYMDIMKKFRPRVEKFASSYDKEKFNKYCFFLINHTWVSKDEKNKGKEFSAMIFCLNPEKTEKEMLERFPEDFRQKYAKQIVQSEDFLSLQQYRLKQNIQIQFFEPHITLQEIQKHSHATGQSSPTGGLPTLYTSFSNEGLVMNLDPNHNPLQVRYSFRYDQVIKCGGENPGEMKKYIKPEISSLFRPAECCISYIVDFYNTCSMAMFCSTYWKAWKCKADIKIFRSTLYKRCLIRKTENIDKKVDRIMKDVKGEKETFLHKAALIYGLRETFENKMRNSLDPNSTLGRILAIMGTKNKTYEAAILATLKPDCVNVFKRIEAKEQHKKNMKKRGSEMGFDLGSKVEDELRYYPGMLSATKVEQLQRELCEEYKKLEELEMKNKDANGNNINNNSSNSENSTTPNGSHNIADNINHSLGKNLNPNEVLNNYGKNANHIVNQNGGLNPSGLGEAGNANGNQPFNNPSSNQNGNNSNSYNPNNTNGNSFNGEGLTNPISPPNNSFSSSPDSSPNFNGNNPNGSGFNTSNNYPNSNKPAFDGVNNKPDGLGNGPNGTNGHHEDNPASGSFKNGLNNPNNNHDGNKGNGFNPSGIPESPLNQTGDNFMNSKNPNTLNHQSNSNNNPGYPDSVGSKGNTNNSNNPFDKANTTNNQSGNNNNLGPGNTNNPNGNRYPNNPSSTEVSPNNSNNNNPDGGFNKTNNADLVQNGDGFAKGPTDAVDGNSGSRNDNNSNSPSNNASPNVYPSENPINNNGLNGDKNNPALGNNKGASNDNSNISGRGNPNNTNNGNSGNFVNNGNRDNSQTNLNDEKQNGNKEAEFANNIEKIKYDMQKANLDPKQFEKLVSLINEHPDIKNSLLINPNAVSEFKHEDLIKFSESTPEGSLRVLREMVELQNEHYTFKRDQFKNTFCVSPLKKDKDSNKIKGQENFKTDSGRKYDIESISPFGKDSFGNPIKIIDKTDVSKDLPKDIGTLYTDDPDHKISYNRPEIDSDSSKNNQNTIKIPVFGESKNKKKAQENKSEGYNNPIEEAASKVYPSVKPEDILNLDFPEKSMNNKTADKVGKNKNKNTKEDDTANNNNEDIKSTGEADKEINANKNGSSDSQDESKSDKASNHIKKSKKISDKKNDQDKKNASHEKKHSLPSATNANSKNETPLNPTSSDKEIGNKLDSVSKKNHDISKGKIKKQGKETTRNSHSSERTNKCPKNNSHIKKSDNKHRPKNKDSSNKFKNNKTPGLSRKY